MSPARPVIASDSGGTKELVHHNVSGYLINRLTGNEIAGLITGLIDDPEKCEAFGKAGRKIIEESFSLHSMGKAFEQTYQAVLAKSEPGNIPRARTFNWSMKNENVK
jgi:glycosyltransferase involved in cell wall biosynthesis